MFGVLSLILILAGCLNWLCIGMLQYDFIAGFFGSQANLFSRVVYVIFGISSLIFAILLIKNKGRLTINTKRLKKAFNKKNKEPDVPNENKNVASVENNKINPNENFQPSPQTPRPAFNTALHTKAIANAEAAKENTPEQSSNNSHKQN